MAASFHGKTRVSELLLRNGAVINRDLLDSLKLKVNIFEESVGGAGWFLRMKQRRGGNF